MIEYVAIFIAGLCFGAVLLYMSYDPELPYVEKMQEVHDREVSEIRKGMGEKQKQIEILQGISDSNAKKLIHANEQVRIQNDIIAQLRSELEKKEKDLVKANENDGRQPRGAKDKDGNSIGGQYAGKKVK